MSITRQQLADDLRTLWINTYDPEAPKQECSDNRWLAVADAAVLALDAADKIARELPEGWFGESTPRPGRGWVVTSAVMGSGSWALTRTVYGPLTPDRHTLTIGERSWWLTADQAREAACIARMALMTWTWGRRNPGNFL